MFLISSYYFKQWAYCFSFFSNLNFEASVLIKLFLYKKLWGWRTIYCKKQNKTKQNCGKGSTSIVVKQSLNFQNINFNIHSLLNENIKSVKLSMADWLTKINLNRKKNTSSSLFIIFYWNTLGSCHSTTSQPSIAISFTGIAQKNVKLEIWNPPKNYPHVIKNVSIIAV